MKKAITLFLAATMLVGSLAGCSGDQPAAATATPPAATEAPATEGTDPDPTEEVVERNHLTLTFTVDDILNYDDPFGVMFQEKFNATIIAKPGDSEESLGLWASAQELPNLWTSVTFEDAYRFYSWIDQGLIRDIPYDMISKYPNVKRIVDESIELNAIKDLKDGKYWYIPRKFDATFHFMQVDGGRIWYRADIAEDLGLTVPTTVDEFMTFVYDMSHSDKPGAPTTSLLNGLVYIYNMYGIDAEGWVKDGDQWIPAYMSDGMLEPLKAIRQLFVDGSLDNEYMVTNNTDLFAKWGSGVGSTMFRNGGDSYWYMRTHRHVAEFLDPENGNATPWIAMDAVELMAVPQAPDGNTYWMPFVDSGGIEISADTTDEELDRILEIIDWTLTEEAKEYSAYGIEGITYTVNPDGTYAHIISPESGVEVSVLEETPSCFVVSMADWGNARAFFVESKWATDDVDDTVRERQEGLKRLDDESKKWTQLYDTYATPSSHEAYIARMLSTPAKDDYYSGFDWGEELNALIADTSVSVEDGFAAFLDKCYQKNMQTVIDEVTAVMAGIGY